MQTLFPFNSDNLLSARYIDDEQTSIEILFLHKNQNVVIICPVEVEDATFNELLKYVTVSQIEEYTKEWNLKQYQAYIKHQQSLIDEGLLNIRPIEDDKFIEKLIDFSLDFDPEKEEHTEKLFRLKLELFDRPEVQNASDEKKEELRKGTTTLAVFTTFIQITANL
jgi:Fe-S cluster biosynthesis and repair protein YggX